MVAGLANALASSHSHQLRLGTDEPLSDEAIVHIAWSVQQESRSDLASFCGEAGTVYDIGNQHCASRMLHRDAVCHSEPCEYHIFHMMGLSQACSTNLMVWIET